MGDLTRRLNGYLSKALSANTRNTYRSGLLAYHRFCCQIQNKMFPLQEYYMQLFVTSLAGKVKYSTIKTYLSGIQYESITLGYSEKISHMARLYYTIRGIRRSHPDNRRQRLPITTKHLKAMLRFIKYSLFSPHDKAMWSALILLAFFGLLRVSEYVTPSTNKFDETIHLSPSDVEVSSCGNIVRVMVKASKTDPFRLGFKIRVCRIGGKLCPVKAIKKYLVVRGNAPGPLFTFSSGEFITRKFVAGFLQASLPNEADLNTHSFRIGGASAAASCGIPHTVIKMLGRWSSDCYKRYLYFSDKAMKQWCTQIAHVEEVTEQWKL